MCSPVAKALLSGKIRGKRGEEPSGGVKKRQDGSRGLREQGWISFCWGNVVLFIGGGGGRPLQTGQSKEGEQPPFSFVGLFPVGRLCAGWMAAFEETQAAIELRVKAGPDSPALRHSNTTALQCLSLLRPARERKGQRQSDRGWGIVGVFDFGRQGRKK